MNLARTMGVVVGFLAILAYGHVISVRLAILIFLLFAACVIFSVNNEIENPLRAGTTASTNFSRITAKRINSKSKRFGTARKAQMSD